MTTKISNGTNGTIYGSVCDKKINNGKWQKNGFAEKEYNFEKLLSEIEEAKDYLLSRTDYRPKIAIVCGTGLGTLTDDLEDKHKFPYEDIPNCVSSTVQGHVGRLVFGKYAGESVVCMQGRIHSYEGHPMWKTTFLIRVFAAMGVRVLILTNAAGGLNPNYKTGDLMIMKDHINLPGLSGLNPLMGLNDEKFGPRFVALTEAYDSEFRQLARDAAHDLKMDDFVQEGVYCYQTGPCFETVTESRMMKIIGADVAGMSTVPEVLVAAQSEIRCLGFSVITNMCILEYDSKEKVLHDNILDVGKTRTNDLKLILKMILPKIADSERFSRNNN